MPKRSATADRKEAPSANRANTRTISVPSSLSCPVFEFIQDRFLRPITQQTVNGRASQRCCQYVVIVSNSSRLSGLALPSSHFFRASPSIVPWDVNSRARDSISGRSIRRSREANLYPVCAKGLVSATALATSDQTLTITLPI